SVMLGRTSFRIRLEQDYADELTYATPRVIASAPPNARSSRALPHRKYRRRSVFGSTKPPLETKQARLAIPYHSHGFRLDLSYHSEGSTLLLTFAKEA